MSGKIKYVSIPEKFDARCRSPFRPKDAVKFPDASKLNSGPCVAPKKPTGTA